MQYCSLRHQTTSITSHIHSWVLFLLWLHLFILSGFISPLISGSILGTYQPGEFIFQCPIFLPFHTVHFLHHILASGQTTGKEHSPTHQQKIKLQIYRAWPCPSEQDPVFPSQFVPSGSFHKSLILIHQRADRMKPLSQKTNQVNHMDHSLI